MFCCWSGGKDSMLSLYRVVRQGIEVSHLVNMINTTGRRSRSHGLPSGLVRRQADILGLPVLQRRASWNTYEREFRRVVTLLKKEGVTGGVFGDIDLLAHREWVETLCREIGLEARLPLWRESREALLREFVKEGFRAIIVAVRTDRLGEEWLGRELDERFISEIMALEGIDICGEEGEYHTFVYDGPLFRTRVPFELGKRVSRSGCGFLELRED